MLVHVICHVSRSQNPPAPMIFPPTCGCNARLKVHADRVETLQRRAVSDGQEGDACSLQLLWRAAEVRQGSAYVYYLARLRDYEPCNSGCSAILLKKTVNRLAGCAMLYIYTYASQCAVQAWTLAKPQAGSDLQRHPHSLLRTIPLH